MAMKRAFNEVHSLISDSSSDSDSEPVFRGKSGNGSAKKVDRKPNNQAVKYSVPEENPAKKRAATFDYAALSRHGYNSGPSVLKVPPPREDDKDRDWSWSTGKNQPPGKEENEESYEDREKTRAALSKGEMLSTALMSEERKNISFAQKEKRKRDLGQASRGKNYVEEEKRLLRDSGFYSGFD